jgi:hypothetical protein
VIAQQLLVLYERFDKVGAHPVCAQLAHLVIVAIGGPAASRLLSDAGMAPQALKEAVGVAEAARTKTAHADKPKTTLGVGMRKKP